MILAEPPATPTPPFSGSYPARDVTFLLRPVRLAPTEITRKERLIQSGRRHYSEMLSAECAPTAEYLRLYERALRVTGAGLAAQVVALARALSRRGPEIVLVSLVRAGTPFGVLLARALGRLGVRAHHYGVSIIRDRGIDQVALHWILARHQADQVVFVDGWTGKGVIARELRASVTQRTFGLKPYLVVIADPAGEADLAATAQDQLIASGMLGAIGSGLISRSVLNTKVVGPGECHACVVYRNLSAWDQSVPFVDAIDRLAQTATPAAPQWFAPSRATYRRRSSAVVERLLRLAETADPNRIKPGIAEAGRALARRRADRLFVADARDPETAHLWLLAQSAGAPVEITDLGPYRALTIIRSLGQG